MSAARTRARRKPSRPPTTLASRIRVANAELLVEGRLETLADHFAPGYVAHLTGRDLRGHAAVRRFLAELRAAFPEVRVEVEILLEGQDRVAWQRTLRAVHRGAFRGFPATGRPLVWRDMVTSRFQRGRIVEDWVLTDLAERPLLARKRTPGPRA